MSIDYLDKKSSDKPFFLYMSYRTPHAHEYFLSKTDLYADKIEEWYKFEAKRTEEALREWCTEQGIM